MQYAKSALFYASVQSYFKQQPLIILKQAMQEQTYQYVCNFLQVDNNLDYIVILPNDNILKNIITDQQVLLLNQNLYLVDKMWNIHYPIICDNQNTIEINSLLQAQIFLDDQLWTVIQPDKEKRFYAIKTIMDMMQQTTYKFGCNFIFKPIQSDSCSAALTCTPPGVNKNYLGNICSVFQIYNLLKYFNWKNIFSLNQINKIHAEYCGDINNHLYVCGIVTDKAYRRCGLGKQIFKILYSIANQSYATIYLENSKDINLLFYTSVGLIPQAKYLCQNQQGQKTIFYAMTSKQNGNIQDLSKEEVEDKLIPLDLIPLNEFIKFY